MFVQLYLSAVSTDIIYLHKQTSYQHTKTERQHTSTHSFTD